MTTNDQGNLFAPRTHAGTTLGFDVAAPPAGHLHRADDQGGSISAAEDAVASGRCATEARLVLRALRRHPGATSAELAEWASDLRLDLEQSTSAWRYTCARRLSGLEDAGLVVASARRPSVHRPHRRVDANLPRCTVTATPAIRWWPVDVSR